MATLTFIAIVTLALLISASSDSDTLAETFSMFKESLTEPLTKMLYICASFIGVIIDLIIILSSIK